MLPLAFALWAGFADETLVRGARPATQVRAALTAVTPHLQACVSPSATAAAELLVGFQILAAGFIDRVGTLAVDDPSGALDESCVHAALHQLALGDRGVEPPTRVVVRLAVTPGGVSPHLGTGPASLARALELRADDVDRCVDVARQKKPGLAGTVVTRLQVDRFGNVAAVDASGGSLLSPAARACIARTLAGARLPEGARGRDVFVPFFFPRPPLAADPRPARRKDAWNEPTLFHFLGCASAFSPS